MKLFSSYYYGHSRSVQFSISYYSTAGAGNTKETSLPRLQGRMAILNGLQSQRLRAINKLKNEDFDILIIGGGSAGSGAAILS